MGAIVAPKQATSRICDAPVPGGAVPGVLREALSLVDLGPPVDANAMPCSRSQSASPPCACTRNQPLPIVSIEDVLRCAANPMAGRNVQLSR